MSSATKALARRIVATLRADGHTAYFVGGCVRDLLLRRPAKDFDVATSARPEAVARLFPGNSDLVGAHFGVVLVRDADQAVEVATFRTDHSYHDGRHPESVTFETDPRQDALRRDFTINAMMMDPDSGRVIDFVGGQGDLESGIVRAVGDPQRRFAEDHLRMLRAVRFAARLGFSVHHETMAAVAALAPRIHTVSAERTRDELLRILTEGSPRRGMELLDQAGLLFELLPEVAAMKGVAQPAQFHPEGDVWTHTLIMLEMMPPRPASTLALGVLLHDVAKPPTFRVAPDRIRFDGHAELGARMAVEILTRLRCSNAIIGRVRELVAHHLRFKDVPRMKESTLKRFLRMDGFEEHLELHRLDCGSSHRMMDNYELCRRKLAEMPPEVLRPPHLVTGHDLIALGLAPGPAFARLLDAIETAQLEERVRTREEAIKLVRELAGLKSHAG